MVAVMVLSVFAVSVSAAQDPDVAAIGDSNVIYFDNSETNWTGPVQFYVYDVEASEPIIPWGSKKLNGTDEGNNIWSKDLSDYGLESSKQYCIIFTDIETGSQTYDLLFDASCLDDTAQALGLTADDVDKAIIETGTNTDWDWAKSSLSKSGSSDDSGSSSGSGSSDSGKWKSSTLASDQYTNDEKKIFSSAMKNKTDALYLPSQVIAKQNDDSGTYYAYLTSVTVLTTDSDDFFDSLRWEITTIFVDKQGNSKLLNSVAVDPVDIKTTDKAPDGWTVSAKSPQADDLKYFSSAVEQALTGYKDVKLDYIAELASQINGAEINRRFLCYGTKDSKTDLYVVEIHDGLVSAEITKVSLFDLSSYAVSPKPADKGADNSSKSPQTGYTDMVMLLMMIALVAFLGACVSAKQLVKKNG